VARRASDRAVTGEPAVEEQLLASATVAGVSGLAGGSPMRSAPRESRADLVTAAAPRGPISAATVPVPAPARSVGRGRPLHSLLARRQRRKGIRKEPW
jgi:hypothetical protein